MNTIGLLGGTFDPVHEGHLDAAGAARVALGLDSVTFVPAHDPRHRRAPQASVFHRFAMLALAVDERPGYRLSDVELTREGASYTIDTLRSLHAQGWEPSQLFFILGADAFADIATWHHFPAVLDAANFAVLARPGTTLDAAIARTPAVRDRVRTDVAARQGDTGVILVQARTRDISSTRVRARCAAGEPIGDLVPAAVARHISAHGLYQRVDDQHG
jgi:nicotinate-nucleotide adenylyltransferase